MQRSPRRRARIVVASCVFVAAALPIAWQGSKWLERRTRREAALKAVEAVAARAASAYDREPTCTGPIAEDDAAACADLTIPAETRIRTCAWCSMPHDFIHRLCLSALPGEDGNALVDGWECIHHSGKGPEGVELQYVVSIPAEGGGWFEARAVGDFAGFDDAKEVLVVRGEVDRERMHVNVAAPRMVAP